MNKVFIAPYLGHRRSEKGIITLEEDIEECLEVGANATSSPDMFDSTANENHTGTPDWRSDETGTPDWRGDDSSSTPDWRSGETGTPDWRENTELSAYSTPRSPYYYSTPDSYGYSTRSDYAHPTED